MKLVNINYPKSSGRFPAVFGHYPSACPPTGCLRSSTAGLFIVLLLALAGCMPPGPLKGGGSHMQSSHNGFVTNWGVYQGENAQMPTTQNQEYEIDESFTIPTGSKLIFGDIEPRENYSAAPATNAPQPSVPIEKSGTAMELSAPMPVTRHVIHKTGATLGAAQKDTSRELAAKFANMKPVQFVGIALLIGAGVLVYFGWYTPAMIAGGTGLGLILLAHSIVGNERIILILAVAAAAIFAVLHAYNKGQLDRILPDALDKNKPTTVAPTVTPK